MRVYVPGHSAAVKPATSPAPSGCIGPRDGPLPVLPHQERELRALIHEAAGETLPIDAVKSVCYLIRRAHGMGLTGQLRCDAVMVASGFDDGSAPGMSREMRRGLALLVGGASAREAQLSPSQLRTLHRLGCIAKIRRRWVVTDRGREQAE